MKVLFLACVCLGSLTAATDWSALGAAQFALRPEIQARVDAGKFDPALMAAAIFHASNQVRARLGLPRFTHLAKLDDAADLKAAPGVLQAELQHENPLPGTRLPADRVKAVGLDYQRVAENIARLPIYVVPAGMTQFGVRERNGREEYFRLDTREPLQVHTYASFATAVVEAWMNSPSHRANLVNPAYASLGAAARPALSPGDRQPQIYAVQVFFAPR